MKMMKKMMALVIAMVMVLAMGVTVFAEDTPITATKGTITVENAAAGETYKIFKIFDATISKAGTDGVSNSIAYLFSGDLPDSLSGVFEKIGDTDYVQKKSGATDAAILSAVENYAKTIDAADSKVGDGGALEFTNVDFGYYVITSTQGTVVSVDSANPNPTVYDKNVKTPSASKKINGKDSDEASIGDTVTYTATFDTANYRGTGSDAKIVKSYTISDTLPDFLSNVQITSLKIIETPASEGSGEESDPDYVAPVEEDSTDLSASYTAFTDKQIVIPWVDATTGKSLYKNGSKIVITYTAVVTKEATVDGTTGNVNTVKIVPNEDSEGKKPFEEEYTDSAKLFTYAAALQKIDENKKPLAGAEFTVAGLQATKNADGDYTVIKYDPSDSTITPTTLVCDSDGQLVVIGLKQNDGTNDIKLTLTETKAPNGYNKLTDTEEWPVVKTGEEITKSSRKIKYDEDGKVVSDESAEATEKTTYNVSLLTKAFQVVNNKGTELPSTGGIGTTIFYVIGAILVLGAGVLLVTRRRMNAN